VNAEHILILAIMSSIL